MSHLTSDSVNNCITVLVDSARTYQTKDDDRGLPDAFLRFQQEAYNFENAYTSAPSTVMSLSGMFTGAPAVFNSIDYKTFTLEKIKSEPLTSVLKKENIFSFGTIYYPEGRYIFRNLFPAIPKKYLNNYYRKRVWGNEYIADIFEKAVNGKHFVNQKNFIYLHLNVRYGEEKYGNSIVASNAIDRILNTIHNSHMRDDSVIIMCSDHGYPNYRHKNNMLGQPHDMIMDNDNIKIPFSIKYPNQDYRHDVKTMIQNIDYYPTILDIFGVANPVSYFHKIEALYPRSLLPLINENSFDNTRLLRIDNRFWGQTNKNKVYISGGNTYTATLHNQNYQWDVNPNAKIAKVDDEIESYLLERVSFDVREFLSSTLSAPAYILDLVKSELSQYLIHTLAAYHLKKFVHVSKLSLKNRQFMNIIIVQLEGASILNIIKYLTLSMFNNILVVDAVGREILPVIKTRLYRKISNVVFDLFSTTS